MLILKPEGVANVPRLPDARASATLEHAARFQLVRHRAGPATASRVCGEGRVHENKYGYERSEVDVTGVVAAPYLGRVIHDDACGVLHGGRSDTPVTPYSLVYYSVHHTSSITSSLPYFVLITCARRGKGSYFARSEGTL